MENGDFPNADATVPTPLPPPVEAPPVTTSPAAVNVSCFTTDAASRSRSYADVLRTCPADALHTGPSGALWTATRAADNDDVSKLYLLLNNYNFEYM